ncbi:Signal transducing MEK kinase [Komagataella phaffii CBS 7435]|uniref:mitogen-activated protein kinase kinase kinase n=2 Tax=Komagataella phaffii TaxID=460519 RepID=C4R4N2_KOMPG|nr:Signal transducing MEK kinase [Komagataella phaffii GS115]CAH2449721.1 Putative mitogen-activated protein kinase STE11 [Komagataella phaffii CBS 7435]CAY70518.1 Signal transducing MEK kinase [Komagataella phaffii GS115]CCA39693.1 Signal transducing MEK kinase [Komagataella phaffii CBS 7435]
MEQLNLSSWLNELQCSAYLDRFEENGITTDLLCDLDKGALIDLGIDKVGPRIRLENEIQRLRLKRLRTILPLERLSEIILPDYASETSLSEKDALGNQVSPLSPTKQLVQKSPRNQLRRSHSSLKSTTDEKSSKSLATFINLDGSKKQIDIRGCFNAMSIKRKALKGLDLKMDPDLCAAYFVNDDEELHLMYDIELVTVCHSADRVERNRIILCKKTESPTLAAIETSTAAMKLARNSDKGLAQENDNSVIKESTEGKPSLNNFFGQRPPSELISTNLAEYFPDTKVNKLQETVRNSVRNSMRISRLMSSQFSNASIFSDHSGNHSRLSSSLSRYAMSNIAGDRASIISSSTRKTIGKVLADRITKEDGDTVEPEYNEHTVRSNHEANSSNELSDSVHERHNEFNEGDSSIIELFEECDDDDTGDDEYMLKQLSIEEERGPQSWLKGARIGAGSFGTVFLGINSFTGELMAVKQVELPTARSVNDAHGQNMLESLKQEISLLRELDHENVVRCIGSSIDDEFLNVFLEYIPGGSVSSMLNNYGPFEEPLIRNFVKQVLSGLAYLHEKQIIHRDIKGANVLIDTKGTVKISDFGISKRMSDLKPSSKRASLQGSVYWMAPEVVKQTVYTNKADIWSVGCLIIEMFTGKHPFPDFSQMQAIFKIGMQTRPEIPPTASDLARSFLESCLESDYTKRSSATDLSHHEFVKTALLDRHN